MLFHEYLLNSFTSSSIILKHKSREYSLNDISNRCEYFVNSLTNAGISKGDRIILLMENGLNAICLQLCCSKIGAVFIPVSPFEPTARLQKIVQQYRPAAILVEDSKFKIDFALYFNTSHVDERITLATGFKQNSSRGADIVTENDTIYIISTSGTTGNPKGIVMSHKAVVCFFKAIVAHCKLRMDDNIGTISPIQFDLSLLDLGLAWGSNACLTVFSQSYAYSPKKLVQAIIDNGVTQFNSVPAIWNGIIRYAYETLDNLTTLQSILYAGDKFTFSNILKLRKKLPNLKIINCFGQSESIACCFYDIPEVNSKSNPNIPIGKGYPGNTFYLVDNHNRLITEKNAIGELWLSNGSLFDKYWANEALTNARLVNDEFNPKNKAKVYKSGDLISRGNDGYLYFHGRKGNQIKVNGNRVELDEIEQVVMKYKNVSDTIALAIKNDDTYNVVLFVSCPEAICIREDSLRKHLRECLPLYMIPSEIVIKNTPFPLNVNGKTDKKKLLELNYKHKV